MVRFVFALAVVGSLVLSVEARWRPFQRKPAVTQRAVSCPDNATAQEKAEIMAAHNLTGTHIGRTQIPPGYSMGYEGVSGPRNTYEEAVTTCCHWGEHEPYEIGAAQNAAGKWFAVVYYR